VVIYHIYNRGITI